MARARLPLATTELIHYLSPRSQEIIRNANRLEHRRLHPEGGVYVHPVQTLRLLNYKSPMVTPDPDAFVDLDAFKAHDLEGYNAFLVNRQAYYLQLLEEKKKNPKLKVMDLAAIRPQHIPPVKSEPEGHNEDQDRHTALASQAQKQLTSAFFDAIGLSDDESDFVPTHGDHGEDSGPGSGTATPLVTRSKGSSSKGDKSQKDVEMRDADKSGMEAGSDADADADHDDDEDEEEGVDVDIVDAKITLRDTATPANRSGEGEDENDEDDEDDDDEMAPRDTQDTPLDRSSPRAESLSPPPRSSVEAPSSLAPPSRMDVDATKPPAALHHIVRSEEEITGSHIEWLTAAAAAAARNDDGRQAFDPWVDLGSCSQTELHELIQVASTEDIDFIYYCVAMMRCPLVDNTPEEVLTLPPAGLLPQHHDDFRRVLAYVFAEGFEPRRKKLGAKVVAGHLLRTAICTPEKLQDVLDLVDRSHSPTARSRSPQEIDWQWLLGDAGVLAEVELTDEDLLTTAPPSPRAAEGSAYGRILVAATPDPSQVSASQFAPSSSQIPPSSSSQLPPSSPPTPAPRKSVRCPRTPARR